jgi:hypothetical protein
VDDRLVCRVGCRCRIDRVISPDDGHIVARNMLRIEMNIQRRNCTPGWFYLQDYTRVHGQQNIKDRPPIWWAVNDRPEVTYILKFFLSYSLFSVILVTYRSVF